MSSSTGNLAIQGIIPSVPINPAQDTNVTTTAPFAGLMPAPSFSAPITRKGAQTTQHLAFAGNRAHAFTDDYYNRIHITQTELPLGNVISEVSTVIGIWNSWLSTSQTLETFVGTNDTGITYEAPGVPPLVFPPGAQFNWTIDVGIVGPPTIDAFFVWSFADGEAVQLEITGSRITAWALRPNWANGVREKLSHKTDLQTAETGTEVRRRLRSTPRRSFEFDVDANGNERRFIESALYAWTAMVWAMPIWPDGSRLTAASALVPGALEILVDTTNRDYVAGGLAMLVASAQTYEVVQIVSLTANSLQLQHPINGTWPAGSRLFPARTTRLTKSPPMSRDGGGWESATVEFQIMEACTWPTVTGLPQYRGVDVLELLASEDNLVDSYERLFETIDQDTGQWTTDDTAGMGFPITGYAFWSQGAAARSKMRSILYSLAGRWSELWVPTWKTDMVLAAQINANASGLDIQSIGYTLFLAQQMGRRDIRLQLIDGTILYRRITSSSTLTLTTERLIVDSAFPNTITLAQVARISFMTLSRQINDDTTINHTNAVDGIATCASSFRGVNHDI